jgi:hypothetical protein
MFSPLVNKSEKVLHIRKVIIEQNKLFGQYHQPLTTKD